MLKIIKIIGSIRYNIKSAGLFQSTGLLLAGLGTKRGIWALAIVIRLNKRMLNRNRKRLILIIFH